MDKLEKFKKFLKLRNYADNTCRLYLYYVSEFLNNVDKPPTHILNKDVIFYIENYEYSSVSYVSNKILENIPELYEIN